VRTDRPELYPRLCRSFNGLLSRVEVVLDRRRGERRGRRLQVAADRREGDRRAGSGNGTGAAAFRLAFRGDGFDVYEATGLVPSGCVECGATVWFELPRFAEPPARLDLHVMHEFTQGSRAQHFVEVGAFTATGRPLLVTRTRGRAPAVQA